jgi:hypothetical protein
MTSKATVVVVQATGNVLGVVTHEGDPERARSAAEVAGGSFPLREPTSGDVLFDVPLAELGTTAVPVVDDLLKTPQRCVVTDGAAGLGISDQTHGVDITATEIKVTVGADPKEREVRVFVERGQGSDRERTVHRVTIPENKAVGSKIATFDPGDYDVLAAVPGHVLLTKSKTI